MVHVHKLVLLGGFSTKEIIQLFDQLGHIRLRLLLHAAAASVGNRLQLVFIAFVESHRLLALVGKLVADELDLGEFDALTFTAKLQQWQQALVEDGTFLDGRVAIVEDLRKEGVEGDVCPPHVDLEEDQCVQLILCGFDATFLVFLLVGFECPLHRFITPS